MESTPAPARPPNPALPYREDCWSEGETSTLIDAWGDRYIELNRGNLRQKQWQEVADAVNSRPCGARRPARTDVQCKNRIDTLKKKYKQEKAKLADGAPSSGWPFFPRLDALIGSNVPQIKKPPPAAAPAATPAPRSPPLALPLPSHRKGFPLPAAAAAAAATVRPAEKRSIAAVDDSFYRRKFSAAAAAAAAAAAEESDSSSRSSRSLPRARSPPRARSVVRSGVRRRRREREGEGMGEEDGIRQLSRAIVRFAEIYEKVEVEKQRQMMELEKQRMEFAKGLEFQRMQIFVDSQVQLEKIKRARRAAAADDADSYYS